MERSRLNAPPKHKSNHNSLYSLFKKRKGFWSESCRATCGFHAQTGAIQTNVTWKKKGLGCSSPYKALNALQRRSFLPKDQESVIITVGQAKKTCILSLNKRRNCIRKFVITLPCCDLFLITCRHGSLVFIFLQPGAFSQWNGSRSLPAGD